MKEKLLFSSFRRFNKKQLCDIEIENITFIRSCRVKLLLQSVLKIYLLVHGVIKKKKNNFSFSLWRFCNELFNIETKIV